MNDREHRTETVCVYKPVTVGPQKKHWVEFQLVDEMGEPLADLPWRAINQAVRDGCVPEYSGVTDAQGVIRLEGLYPLDMTLLMEADPLATVLQQRRLRTERPEPEHPSPDKKTPVYGPQPSGFSPIEQRARTEGHAWHYLRVGQLCDQLPRFNPPLDNSKSPPPYHFPDATFSGFTARYEELNRRHVLEVCPLRAWSLILHHQTEYSLTNAYNLALMSNLAYSKHTDCVYGSISYFFERQCLDLTRTPHVWDGGQNWPCVVEDVPFDERYTMAELLDTNQGENPKGHTQLLYAISEKQLLIAWRGTEFSGRFLPDILTDVAFRPVKPDAASSSQPLEPCLELTEGGLVHLGFLESFQLAHLTFPRQINREIREFAKVKQLFICGHSLGGALALLHAAKLKDQNPLLYTYGMPRTLTLKAVKELSAIKHFRHVNDTDMIPSVPFEADLDNHLYKLYGPLGIVLGASWSVGQAATTQLIKFGDPYCHHGEVAMFYMVSQHVRQRASTNRFLGSRDGLGAPFHTIVTERLPEKALLHLVPSLCPAESDQAEQAQGSLIKGLDEEARARYFPKYSNPKTGGIWGVGNHFMLGYTSQLRHSLLEALNSARQLQLKAQFDREAFELQMANLTETAIADELDRNRIFLELHKKINEAVEVTRQYAGGPEGLWRFDQLASRQAEYNQCFRSKPFSKESIACSPE